MRPSSKGERAGDARARAGGGGFGAPRRRRRGGGQTGAAGEGASATAASAAAMALGAGVTYARHTLHAPLPRAVVIATGPARARERDHARRHARWMSRVAPLHAHGEMSG